MKDTGRVIDWCPGVWFTTLIRHEKHLEIVFMTKSFSKVVGFQADIANGNYGIHYECIKHLPSTLEEVRRGLGAHFGLPITVSESFLEEE